MVMFMLGMMVLGMIVWLVGFAAAIALTMLVIGIISGIYHGIKKHI